MKNNSMGGNDMIQGNKKYPIKGTDIQLKRIGFGAMHRLRMSTKLSLF